MDFPGHFVSVIYPYIGIEAVNPCNFLRTHCFKVHVVKPLLSPINCNQETCSLLRKSRKLKAGFLKEDTSHQFLSPVSTSLLILTLWSPLRVYCHVPVFDELSPTEQSDHFMVTARFPRVVGGKEHIYYEK